LGTVIIVIYAMPESKVGMTRAMKTAISFKEEGKLRLFKRHGILTKY
jgi:hypothetical protein